MKIFWAQDFDFLTHPGGAQLTDRAHFLEGIRRGHDLRVWNPMAEINDEDLVQGVNVVASNPAFLPADAFQLMMDKGIPYVWFLHDYLPVCKYRLFYPLQELCLDRYLKERWLPMLLGAKLIIWLSPLHRNSWLVNCPELETVTYHLSPSPVNVDSFYDMKIERSGTIAVESLHPFKGRDQILKWAMEHPEVQVDILGGNPMPQIPLPPNCKDMGSVPSGRMNEVYNHYETFLHLPQNPSPFDRTIVEAYLAGCKVIGNELIGALSYTWFTSRDNVRLGCGGSSDEFWNNLEGAFS